MRLDVGCWFTAFLEFRAQQVALRMAVLQRYCPCSIRVSQVLAGDLAARGFLQRQMSLLSCIVQLQEVGATKSTPFFENGGIPMSTGTQEVGQVLRHPIPLHHKHDCASHRVATGAAVSSAHSYSHAPWRSRDTNESETYFRLNFWEIGTFLFPAAPVDFIKNFFCCCAQVFESAPKSKVLFPMPGGWHGWDNGKSKQTSTGKRFYLSFDFFSVSNMKGCKHLTWLLHQ